MSFSQYLNEEFETTTPKPNKTTILINMSEYKDMVIESVLSVDKKILLKRMMNQKEEIPIFCESSKKFFMCDFANKKKRTREIKSREDKALCGVLLNGMIVKEHKKGNLEKVEILKNMNLNWDAPAYVYKTHH